MLDLRLLSVGNSCLLRWSVRCGDVVVASLISVVADEQGCHTGIGQNDLTLATVYRVTGRFSPSSVRPWTFHPKTFCPWTYSMFPAYSAPPSTIIWVLGAKRP